MLPVVVSNTPKQHEMHDQWLPYMWCTPGRADGGKYVPSSLRSGTLLAVLFAIINHTAIVVRHPWRTRLLHCHSVVAIQHVPNARTLIIHAVCHKFRFQHFYFVQFLYPFFLHIFSTILDRTHTLTVRVLLCSYHVVCNGDIRVVKLAAELLHVDAPKHRWC